MCAKLYDTVRETVGEIWLGENVLLRKITLLEQAAEQLPAEQQLQVCELLTQAYIDYGSLYENNSSLEKALAVITREENYGWKTYSTTYNRGAIYQMLGRLTEAGTVFQRMLDIYGEDYIIYKRLAFLEVEVQAEKLNEERDYQDFLDYYKKENDAYQKQLKNNKTDTEM